MELKYNATLLVQILHFFLIILLIGLVIYYFMKKRVWNWSREWRLTEHQQAKDLSTSTDSVCLRCGAKLELLGVEKFRCGGTTGGWKLIFGEWAELGEQMIPLEVWACPHCRKAEFRVPAQE
ncbi:MAG: hypothetical protein AB1510_00740 [Bacillota bacterium]